MGTGKSLMALEAARRSGLSIAVIAPPFLRGTWESESKKMGLEVTFFSYTMLHREPAKRVKDFKFWIVDEIHYLKNPRAGRTSAFYELLKLYPPEYLVGLTGTPIKNRVPDFWTLIGFCSQNSKNTSGAKLEGELRKYNAFCRHFCQVQKIFIGKSRSIDKFTDLKPEKILEFKYLLKDKVIRYTVADVLKELPDITRKEVYLDLEETEGLEDEFKAYQQGHKTDIRGKCANALLKAPQTAMYCKFVHDETNEPLLIFTDHVASASLILTALSGLRVALITGAVKSEDRIKIVNRFQSGEIDAIVATIGSLSVGVTLTAAKHVVFNDLSWVPADNLQAEKRIHRIGQKSACFSHFIISSPTDAYIQKTLVSKMKTISTVMEG